MSEYDQSEHPFGADPDLVPVQDPADVSEEFAMMMERAAFLQRSIDAYTTELKTILKPAIAANLLFAGFNSIVYSDREFVYTSPHLHSSLDAEGVKNFLLEMGASPAQIADRCYKRVQVQGGVSIRKRKS